MGKNRLVGWLLCRLGSYPAVIGLLELSLDRELSFRERVALRFHDLLCSYCERLKKRLRAIREIIQTGQDVERIAIDEADRLSPEARERIKKALRKAIHDLESQKDDTG